MQKRKPLFKGILSLISAVLLASQAFAATGQVNNFTTSATSVAPGQSIHVTTSLTADTALTKAGYIQIRLKDANANIVKVLGQTDYNTMAAGATINVAGDYVIPANAAAAGPYSLDANVWSPEINLWKGTPWGYITIVKAVVPTAHVNNFTTSATSVAPGQSIHLTTSLTADTALTKAGYIQLRLKDTNGNLVKVINQANFNTLAAGATLNVAGDYVIPANAAAAGPYSLDANVWSPEVNLWKGSAWGLITIIKAVVPTAHVNNFTTSANAVAPGQTIHVATSLTADTALTKAGYIQIRLKDANANLVKVLGQADYNTLAAGATLNVAGDYVIPANAAAAGPYSLDANVWSPEINIWKGTAWGLITITKAVVVTAPPVVTPPVVTPPVVTPPVVTPPVVTPPVVTPPVVTPPVVTPPVVTPPVVTPPVPASTLQVGVWYESGCSGVQPLLQYEGWFGGKAQHLLDNLDQSAWSNLAGDTSWEIGCIKNVANTTPFTLGIPMIPADGVSTLAKGAAGAYDSYFTAIATQLVAAGLDKITLRVGWEFNGNWQPWASYKDPVNFIKDYQRIVTLMRAVPGQHFTFDWCPNIGQQALAPDQSYPGDAYVDYIGMDVYDAVWSTYDVNYVNRWNTYVNQAYGLQWQVNFAKLHNKQLSLPEWGAGGDSAGDDPYYVTEMALWVKANKYAYIDYWNSNAAYQGELSTGQYPQAAAAYLKNFK